MLKVQEFKVHKEFKVLLVVVEEVYRVLKVLKEFRVLLVLVEFRVLKVQQESRVL